MFKVLLNHRTKMLKFFNFPYFLSVPHQGHIPILHQRGEDKQFLLEGAIELGLCSEYSRILSLRRLYRKSFMNCVSTLAPRTANR